jgi:hypothetical protein
VAQQIGDVLDRRDDLSTFAVHLTRSQDGVSAKERLKTMLDEGEIQAMTPMGWPSDQDDPNDPANQTQRVACFRVRDDEAARAQTRH